MYFHFLQSFKLKLISYATQQQTMSSSSIEDKKCPLCCNKMDITDNSLSPCRGYKIISKDTRNYLIKNK